MKRAKKAVASRWLSFHQSPYVQFGLRHQPEQSYHFYFRHNCFHLLKNDASFKIDLNIADVHASFGNQICRGKRDKPVPLIEIMIGTLCCLPHHNAISTGTKGLPQASSSHQRRVLASAPNNRYSSSVESELSVSWDAGDENHPLPSQGTPECTLTVTRHEKICCSAICLRRQQLRQGLSCD